MNWKETIITNINANKEFRIWQVNNIEILLTTSFDEKEYSKIVAVINQQNWTELLSFQFNNTSPREYLDVIKFTDEKDKVYIATIYDSDALYQDPQIIDIFLITEK